RARGTRAAAGVGDDGRTRGDNGRQPLLPDDAVLLLLRVRDARARASARVRATNVTQLLARVGVVFCVVLTLAVCLRWLFHDALPGQDFWATLNSSQTYNERTFPSDEFIGSGHVAEDGR